MSEDRASPVRWAHVMMGITLAAPAVAIIWQNAANSTKLDHLTVQFNEVKATIYTKEMARADQKSQELFNSMMDIRMRVAEEQLKQLTQRGGTK